MRLLKRDQSGNFVLASLRSDHKQPYAILSHTWLENNEDEVTFQDIQQGVASSKPGYQKLVFCATQAEKDGFEYFWVDTCCINKDSSPELSESLISMFRWYAESAVCYVYLSDVRKSQHGSSAADLSDAIRRSRWFTRGWTLQELLAPSTLTFFDCDGICLGDKSSLLWEIHEATGIDVEALEGGPLHTYHEGQRMQWAANRETTKVEDRAYCLQGILGIVMSPLYGEGFDEAMDRLERKVKKSIQKKLEQGGYVWVRSTRRNGLEYTHYLHDALYHKLRRQERCPHCGTRKHVMRECFANASTVNDFRLLEGLCYACGSSDHYAEICPFEDDRHRL